MNSSTTTTAAAPKRRTVKTGTSTKSVTELLHSGNPEKVRFVIELGLTMDTHSRSETLARLIAGSIHGGPDTALYQFAETGELHSERALEELGATEVPLDQETWIDALGRYVITRGARS